MKSNWWFRFTVLLTFVVMFIMGRRRMKAFKGGDVAFKQFKTMSLDDAPEHVVAAGRNFINQFEMPVLFFVIVGMSFHFGFVSLLEVALAWVYVLLRLVHTAIHLKGNDVKKRYLAFVFSSLVLLVFWLTFAVKVIIS